MINRALLILLSSTITIFISYQSHATNTPPIPEGEWIGTAPYCAGGCPGWMLAYCRAKNANVGCYYSPSVPFPSEGFNKSCDTGLKEYCISALDHNMFDSTTGTQVSVDNAGQWRGTAPSCAGRCEEGEFAFCVSSDGESCKGFGTNNIKDWSGFGKKCATGNKVFCISRNFLF